MINKLLIFLNSLALVAVGYWYYMTRDLEPLSASILAIATLVGLIWQEKSDSEKKVVNVTSYNQSGGITANQVTIGDPPRVLNFEIKSELERILSDKKGQTITIVSTIGDSEAYSFAMQIKNYLIQQGHTVKGVNQATHYEPIKGQIFNPDKLELIIGTKQ